MRSVGSVTWKFTAPPAMAQPRGSESPQWGYANSGRSKATFSLGPSSDGQPYLAPARPTSISSLVSWPPSLMKKPSRPRIQGERKRISQSVGPDQTAVACQVGEGNKRVVVGNPSIGVHPQNISEQVGEVLRVWPTATSILPSRPKCIASVVSEGGAEIGV